MDSEIASFAEAASTDEMLAPWAGKSLKAASIAVLQEASIVEKARLAFAIAKAWNNGSLTLDDDDIECPSSPGRPQKPMMVHPSKVKSTSKKQMLHALVHAESYAIDLSWDIIARYGWRPESWAAELESSTGERPAAGSAHMPREFFDDWVRVAVEEAKHMTKWRLRLEQLGGHYGEYNAHDSLWESATDTADSLPARLAIVHCVHEARGLDVYTGMLERLQNGGDDVSVAILKANHEEEIDHVRKGARWLRYCCETAGVDPQAAFHQLVRKHFHGALRPPFNDVSRGRAGMPPEWYVPLAARPKDGEDFSRVVVTEEDMG